MTISIQLPSDVESRLDQLANQGLTPEAIIKNALLDYLAEEQAIRKADSAYKDYLDGKETAHNFNDVVKELGLENRYLQNYKTRIILCKAYFLKKPNKILTSFAKKPVKIMSLVS
jgi:predicted transcriptional regulator